MIGKFTDIFRSFGGAREDAPLSALCSFRTGGKAELLLTPSGAGELSRALSLCAAHAVPYTLLGAGSNVLISDKGVAGAVIRIGRPLAEVRVEGRLIRAGAGARLSLLSRVAGQNGLAGLEFCAGIPGTLGGGLVTNAGAYGGDLGGVARSVRVMTAAGKPRTIAAADCGFCYRGSVFEGAGLVITGATLCLDRGDPSEIRRRAAGNNLKRRASTPMGLPSAGSVFKRPPNDFAARLIEEAGLKGIEIGGARVSEVHAGFIVNTGNAASQDIYDLMVLVRERVYQTSGVLLEPEIKLIGEF